MRKIEICFIFFIFLLALVSLAQSSPQCSSDKECTWCGLDCVPKAENLTCILITPPKNCECKCVENRCTVVCITIFELIKNITLNITKEIEPTDLKVMLYLKEHPETTELLIDSIIHTLNKSPELLIDFDKLAKESLATFQVLLTSKPLTHETPETLGISWWDIIKWLLRQLFKRAEVDILSIYSYSPNICPYFLATSAGFLSTKAVSDLGIIGYIGDDYLTLPTHKFLTTCFETKGQHYVIVYPTIADHPAIRPELRELIIRLFGDGFLVNIYDNFTTIIPTIRNFTIIPINLTNIIIPLQKMNITVYPLTKELKIGEEISTEKYKIKVLSIERPKLFGIIPMFWAKPDAVKIKVYNQTEELTTMTIQERTSINVGQIRITPAVINSNKVNITITISES